MANNEIKKRFTYDLSNLPREKLNLIKETKEEDENVKSNHINIDIAQQQQQQFISNVQQNFENQKGFNKIRSNIKRISARQSSTNRKNKPLVVLMPPENGDNSSCGTMYDMFQSQMFSLCMFMQYYNKKFENDGIHKFLTNKLFDYSMSELEFYVPQLCFMLVKRNSQALEKFLSAKCSQSIPTFFLINWCFQAFSDVDKRDKRKLNRIEHLEKILEQAMVNGNLDLTDQPTQSVQQFFTDKANKLKYQQSVTQFINNLIEISLTLKSIKQEDRKRTLKDYIAKANRAIQRYRERNRENDMFHGIMFPFAQNNHRSTISFSNINSEDEKIDNNQWKSDCIINIVQDECTCFNTKKRVPYRIVVETIDIQELKIQQPKQIKQTYYVKTTRSDLSLTEDNNTGIIDDFLGTSKDQDNDTKQRLESLMKDLVQQKRTRNFQDLKKLQEKEKKQEEQQQTFRKKGATFFQAVISQMQVVKQQKDLNEQQFEVMEETENEILTLRQKISKILSEKKKFKSIREELDFDLNMKRFEILFPTKNIERSHSCIDLQRWKVKKIKQQLEKDYQFNPKNNYHFMHIRQQQLTTLKRINFFKMLLKQDEYQKYKTKIWDIYKGLQLDIYDIKFQKQIQGSNAMLNEKEIELSQRIGPWDELWEYQAQLIRRKSPYELFQSYRLRPIIVKGGDDLRQEILAMQVIRLLQDVWTERNLDLWIHPYEIIVTSPSSGILEFCTDTFSIDGLKKKMSQFKTLDQIFLHIFSKDLEQAQNNFINSLAAYSILCYILQIKDRHNGNILMDAYGHIIHIDFGFMLVTSPGGINFESAPFKLTQEYVQIMGGKNSKNFIRYKELIFKGMAVLRRVVDDIVTILEIMMQDSDLSCFEKFDINQFRERFQETTTDRELNDYVNKLIDQSYNNWKTIQYDNFQRMTNGIMP